MVRDCFLTFEKTFSLNSITEGYTGFDLVNNNTPTNGEFFSLDIQKFQTHEILCKVILS